MSDPKKQHLLKKEIYLFFPDEKAACFGRGFLGSPAIEAGGYLYTSSSPQGIGEDEEIPFYRKERSETFGYHNHFLPDITVQKVPCISGLSLCITGKPSVLSLLLLFVACGMTVTAEVFCLIDWLNGSGDLLETLVFLLPAVVFPALVGFFTRRATKEFAAEYKKMIEDCLARMNGSV